MQVPENQRELNSAHTSMASMQSTPTEDLTVTSTMPPKENFSTHGAEEEPHHFLYVPDSAAEDDSFDTTRPDWSFERHLARQLEQGDAYGQLPKASETSLLFENLQVFGMGAGATYQNTVGLDLQAPIVALKKLVRPIKNPEKMILHGIDGVIREGQMLLVLGRPGSGCTTLLKALAGFTEGYHRWAGSVRYNGVDVSIVKERFRGDIAYNPEVDTHFPHLTVGQTLKFAVQSRAPGSRRTGQALKAYVAQQVDLLATTYGLRHTLKTKVGDDYVRGISGGERKRVSIAEMVAGRSSVGFWDNPTRGLDASTSLEFVQALRTTTDLARTTAIVAAYQAGEHLTLKFDQVTILYLGRQIFFGTLADARAHFESHGFICQPGQTTADFLTTMTDPGGRRLKEGWEHRSPRSVDDFVRCWRTSTYYTQLQVEIARYKAQFGDVEARLEGYKSLQNSQKTRGQRNKSVYLASIGQQFIYTVRRAYQRILGDRVYLVATAFSAIFMSLIIGSVFVNTTSTTSGFFSKGGVIFFCVLFNALQTMSEISTQYAQRPVVQKQSAYGFYHPFVDALSSIFADYPFKALNVFIFDVIVYFMVGLKQEVGAFFIFLLITFLVTVVMSALFRTIAAATKQAEQANGIVGVLVLVLSIYTGYVIPVPSMHPWFKWLKNINPVSYAFEALMVNEFHASEGRCAALVPSGPAYKGVSIVNQVCAVTGARPGNPTVSGDDYLQASFQYSHSHLWRNVAILLAFTVAFVVTTAIATEFMPPASGNGEYLVFRKGHEPSHVKKALEAGTDFDDAEVPDDGAILFGTSTNVSEFHGLVESKDVFTWEHVNYDITMADGKVQRLLSDNTGFVKPGTLTALMGESGAGKTTLLNVLAQRVNMGVVSGESLVNGAAIGRSFQRRTAYVQQQDLHLGTSTVREALRFSAILRQPQEVPVKDKYAYVERVIQMLEMEDYVEAVIGFPGNGLNAEQRKRTTIGIELVAKPALLLFLDEPTSGLDSQSAWSIVKLLRKLANSGQAILCTIHQPSSVLFSQFDRLLLLKKGGQMVYFGAIGDTAEHVIHYFESNGAFKCPKDENPAEYILNVIGAGATARVDRDWGEIWQRTENAREVMQETAALKAKYEGSSTVFSQSLNENAGNRFAVGWLTQYKAMQVRVFQNYWRSPGYVVSKAFLNIVAGLLLGFTFYKEPNTVQGLQNKLFAIFMAAILAMPLMNQTQLHWESLVSLYSARERPSKMYHWSVFVLSNVITEIPFNLVAGTLFFLPWYFAVGFWHGFSEPNRASRGAYQWLMIMLFEMWWSTFGQVMSALSPNAQTATTLSTLFASFVVTFNGVLQPLQQLIGFWHWMYYLSPFTWLISGLMSNSVFGIKIVCSTTEVNVFNPPKGQTCSEYAGIFLENAGEIYNPNATTNCQYCRYSIADQYLASVNMSYADRWRNLGLLCAYIIFNATMVFVAFWLTKVVQLNLFGWATKFGKKQLSKSNTRPTNTKELKRHSSVKAHRTRSENGQDK